jgi:23S rRNA (pseudouridine1915-N3)-methyltransferase
MRIHLLAVGRRMPDWVDAGVEDYARRLPPEWGFALKEIPASTRRMAGPDRCKDNEGRRLLAALPRDVHLAALDEHGKAWSTSELAARIGEWLQSGFDAALMIGGPDGLAQACLERADERWCLSRLTLPHGLVRVIVAEQLYRASTLMRGHPYHRG